VTWRRSLQRIRRNAENPLRRTVASLTQEFGDGGVSLLGKDRELEPQVQVGGAGMRLCALWRWAKRRHSTNSRQWIYDKYFQKVSERKWVFFGEAKDSEGKSQTIRLFHAFKTPIRRHVKVRDAANAYDPAWEVYFEARLGVKMSNTLRGRRKLSALWREQNGICPLCQQKITRLTGWHNHHIVERVHGGEDCAQNRVLLHPECHRQLHSQRLSVVKPRPSPGVGKA
jgi:RNA-directed DNA polymerase